MSIIFLILAVVFLVLWRKASKQASAAQEESNRLTQSLDSTKTDVENLRNNLASAAEKERELESKVSTLSKYQGIADVDAEIQKKRAEADTEILSLKTAAAQELSDAKQDAKEIRAKGRADYDAAVKKAEDKLASIDVESKRIITEAETRAKEIAGEAYEIAGKAKDYEKTAVAMKNVIEGYGDRYLKPTYSLLDDLAEDFGYTEAGQQLKLARENSTRMINAGTAAVCDYAQASRKDTAIAFVIDAFNGKVDSILSKVKKDNYGTLEQKIKDAYELVNFNGRAFRNAVITPEYLAARLEELKWGVRAQELKAQAQEEQRRLREQIREEERARREYEKAMKDAAKEEEMLRKAMEKAQKQIESANEANRAEYESKLEELKQKLAEAEERGQRALSMAQQTKHGNVYVISNLGSFGENVYKVGMTRRLDPLDRVRELGDASVPFPFDVHAIIESDDAPSLETSLHKALSLMQVNKVNPRKEFFRVTISDIKAMVEKMGLTTSWTMDAAAAEYRETLAIEDAMKNDPDAKRRWEEYNAAVTSQAGSTSDDEDAQ
ncbi:DUF4041 domain-containing protein [uncultured Dysosmobacter sp.]|uniref:DUF4041 domain-containing protein n=1 Tax=uncultured Dysosmobacter sp. TaxID=2591384 RepID=UPI002671532E|nr:DUF4041 domain-containing protein [uncultured Dysosmobacter sp.]